VNLAEILDFYDREVAQPIHDKYGLSQLEALRAFMNSKTYDMLANPQLEMWEFSPLAIFDMWEVEQLTQDPRNSVYLRDAA
jgi:hypothetical protein